MLLDIHSRSALGRHLGDHLKVLSPEQVLLDGWLPPDHPELLPALLVFVVLPVVVVVVAELPVLGLPEYFSALVEVCLGFGIGNPVDEVLVLVRVDLVAQGRQVGRAVLEVPGIGHDKLMEAVQHLDENRGALAVLQLIETTPLLEGVPVGHELLLDQDAEPIESAEEGVHDHLGEHEYLGYPVEGIQLLQYDIISLLY